MGIGKFQPSPHKIDTPEMINKKVGTVDYVHEKPPIPNLVQIHPLRASGQMVRVQVRPVDGFLHATAQKT